MAVSQNVYRRRRLNALGLVAAAALLTGAAVGAGGDSAKTATTPAAAVKANVPKPPKATELPMGGRTIFPRYRVVAFYGAPQDKELGELGIGTPASAGRRLVKQAIPYQRRTRPVMPAMELLATVANRDPGTDGLVPLAPVRRRDRALPQGGAQDQGAARARHPARARGLHVGVQAPGEVAAPARRRPRAGPRVAHARRRPRHADRLDERQRRQPGVALAGGHRARPATCPRSSSSCTSSRPTWSPTSRPSSARASSP